MNGPHRSAAFRLQNSEERTSVGLERGRWDLPPFCSLKAALLLTAFLIMSQSRPWTLRAQTPSDSPVPKASPSLPVPPPATARSPVDLFRELLAMKPMERRLALTNRTPENQTKILAKIREYESLKPDQRELKLEATELRWYLLPRMSVPPTNRDELLASVPEHIRPLVKNRLNEWDLLPPNLQKELLTNEVAIHFFTGVESTNLSTLSPPQREKLEKGLDQWQQLKEEQRQLIVQRFYHFFDLSDHEKEKALERLSEPERRQIEKTLHSFDSLSPSQRARAIRYFPSFAGMSPEERQQFLKSAERWKRMTPSQRQEWVKIVNQVFLEPPMPPNLNLLPPPPIPRRASPRDAGPVLTTNGN